MPPVEDHGLNGINLGTRYQVSSTPDSDGNYSLTPVIGGINDNIEPTRLPWATISSPSPPTTATRPL